MIIGHKKQWQFLKRSVELDKFSHAYLFSGPEKLGKKQIALEFVKLLNGQAALKREHPDLLFITPSSSSSEVSSEIQIDQIRELSWKLSLKPYLAPIKFAIIDQAHLMNAQSQNCLLKTLEEPKGKAILILISEQPERLFPTILSRCQIIKFFPVKKIEIEEYLKAQGLSEKTAKEIANFSLGRPGIALDFLSAPQKFEDQKKAVKDLSLLLNSNLAWRFQYAKGLSGESQNLKETLEIWLSYFRNVLLGQCSNFEVEQVEHRRYSFSRLKNIINQIQSTIFLISTTNVNPRLSLEVLLMDL